MEPAALITIQSSTGTKSWVVPLSVRAADALSLAFERSRGLMPGEAVSTVAEAWRSLEGLELLEVVTQPPVEPPPPPSEQDMTPPDPAQVPIDGEPETPAAQPVEAPAKPARKGK